MNVFEEMAEQALVQTRRLKVGEIERVFSEDPEFYSGVLRILLNSYEKQKKDTAKLPPET